MKNKEDIKHILEQLRYNEEKSVSFDEDAIIAAYQDNNERQSLFIKILSVIGGILASLAFLGFLFLAGIYESETGLLFVGGVCIVASILLSSAYDKIIVDTLSVAAFMIGFALIGVAIGEITRNENTIGAVFIVMALVTLCIVRNYMLSFVSVLIVNGSILALIIMNEQYSLINVYVSVLALLMSCCFLQEAKLITLSKSLSKLYNPVRTALVFSLLSVFVLQDIHWVLPVYPALIWLPNLIIVLIIIYLVTKLFKILDITPLIHKLILYACTVLGLWLTALSPAISGAILIILLSFLVNYKTALAIGIVAFIYFVSRHYYDLHYTLLTKSVYLLLSGVFFIAFYLFTSKKKLTNEKV